MYYAYHISLKSHYGEILFQSPVRCGNNSRAASIEIDKHTTSTISIAAHLYVWILCVHICIGVDPLPCGEISRVAFIGMIYLKGWQHFEGGNNSGCGKNSRKRLLTVCTTNARLTSAVSKYNSLQDRH